MFWIERGAQLSPDQESRVKAYYRHLLERAVSTADIDESAVEGAIKKLYRLSGYNEPVVVWCESPWQLVVVPVLLQMLLELGRQSPLWRQVEESLTYPRWASCRLRVEAAAAAVLAREEQARAKAAVGARDGETYQELTRPGSPAWKTLQRLPLGWPLQQRLLISLGLFINRLEAEFHRSLGKRATDQLRAIALQSGLSDRFMGPREQVLQALATEAEGSFMPWPVLEDTVVEGESWSRSPLALEFCEQIQEHLQCELGRQLVEESRQGRGQFSLRPAEAAPERSLMAELKARFSLRVRNIRRSSICFSRLAARVFSLTFPGCPLYNDVLTNLLNTWMTVSLGGFIYCFLSKVCLVCQRPIAIEIDHRGQLHHSSRSAIAFGDGYELYSWHGVTVPFRIIGAPETISVKDIDSEPNLEVRRVMMERFGHGRYIKESGATIIDRDECGTLYRRKFRDDEALVMVEVKDATVQPDGSRRTYFLRVPPWINTAREAVAWTFAMTASEYAPEIET